MNLTKEHHQMTPLSCAVKADRITALSRPGTIAFSDVPAVSCLPFMIRSEIVTQYIRQALPDAEVSVTDLTGTADHLSVRVVSNVFAGKNILDRHRMIYQALSEPMKDGRIHALELKAETRDGS